MKSYYNYRVEDFVTDLDFIKWVLSVDEELDTYWEDVKNSYPLQIENIEEAIFLIKSIQVTECSIAQSNIDALQKRIFAGFYAKKSRKIRVVFRWAAIFLALLALSGIVYQVTQTTKVDLAQLEIPDSETAEIIFADGSTKAIDSENSSIVQEDPSRIIVDTDTVILDNKRSADKVEMVTVVMPYGKQTRLQLSDGSVIHINAGSKVSYPVRFVGDKRDIYLSGEAYFEVETDKKKPFIVHTNEMDIRVTGTEFNVSAYSDDDFTQAVLVSGAVEVDRKSLLKRNIQLYPGESLSYDKSSNEVLKEVVNVDRYTSWINGYIICETEPVSEVIKKLERFYNCTITCKESVSGITFSGKLDLKGNIDGVVEALSFASPMEIEIHNEVI